jgi:hypothetical protein
LKNIAKEEQPNEEDKDKDVLALGSPEKTIDHDVSPFPKSPEMKTKKYFDLVLQNSAVIIIL